MAPTLSPLRHLLEDRVSQLLAEAEQWAGEARQRATRECAERLNQAVRRIRQAGSREELGAALVDASMGFATGAALFAVDGETARLENVRGAEAATEALRAGIPLASAPALRGAVESRDPVMAAATPGEVSAALAEALGQGLEERVSILPIVIGERVPAILCAWGALEGSALELLSQVAAASWGAHEAPEPVGPAGLVAIAPAAPAGSWDSLPAEQQQIHLRAQRLARVAVAEMRLLHSGAVQAGRARRNLYASLRQPIDTARADFRQKFFADCSSMVDYLHLELVRTLANDDAELLGQDYPGPLV